MNSQSGKGGVAYIMKTEHNLDLPRRLQIEFSRVVQAHTDADGGEVSPQRLWDVFSSSTWTPAAPLQLRRRAQRASGGRAAPSRSPRTWSLNGRSRTITGEGNGPVSAFVDAISAARLPVRVLDYHEHALSAGGDALAAAYVECEVGDGETSSVVWGVGMDANIVTASLKAVARRSNRPPASPELVVVVAP